MNSDSDDDIAEEDEQNRNQRQPRNVQVVNRASQNTEGMSFRARLNFGGLGPLTNVKRVFSSRSRTLYVGAIPT